MTIVHILSVLAQQGHSVIDVSLYNIRLMLLFIYVIVILVVTCESHTILNL